MAPSEGDLLPGGSPRMRASFSPSFPASPAFRGSSLAAAKMADKVVTLKEQKLLDVKLGQLPSWLAARDFSLNGFVLACQAGYRRFNNKYVLVNRGGTAGISILLAAYVVISYSWCYPHLKTQRKRKYH